MKIITKAILDMETLQWVSVEYYDYEGPVELACGPSNQEKAIAGQQLSLSTQLSQFFGTRFSQQSSVLQNLNNLLTPIAEAGPDQQGFGPQELAALHTQATEGVGANYEKATRALQNVLAAQGGGNEFLPTGAKGALQGTIATAGAAEQSRLDLGITEANYATGRKNWEEATRGLSSLANQYDPLGYAGGAQKGFDSSFNMADKISQEQNQAEASIYGGIASLGMDALTFGAGGMGNLGGAGTGTSFGENIGNFFSGGVGALGGGH
jgi:hypothetical protein